jgi:hypothetical protein
MGRFGLVLLKEKNFREVDGHRIRALATILGRRPLVPFQLISPNATPVSWEQDGGV